MKKKSVISLSGLAFAILLAVFVNRYVLLRAQRAS